MKSFEQILREVYDASKFVIGYVAGTDKDYHIAQIKAASEIYSAQLKAEALKERKEG